MIRKYSDLVRFPTFQERYDYLKLEGRVGTLTFGFERYLNQKFYNSLEWRQTRNQVIVRDNGCDLGILGFEVFKMIVIHHMNPVSVDDFRNGRFDILNPDYLISTSAQTHRAIHFGDSSQIPKKPVPRKPNDTTPWL
jgi:hypothetical protein